jgi:hypothetical protein
VADSLASRLPGTWRLQDYEAIRADGEVYLPNGEAPRGVIQYSADGEVSVHIANDVRALFAGGDLAEASEAEFAAAARSYFAYFGRYEVDETKQTVTHRLEMCLVPNWSGAAQVRHAKIEGDVLTLTGHNVRIAGALRTINVTWKRAVVR